MKEVCHFTRFGKVKKDVENLKYENKRPKWALSRSPENLAQIVE